MTEPIWPSPLEDQLRFLGYDAACEASDTALWAVVQAYPDGQAWPDVRQIPFLPGVDGFYDGLEKVRAAVSCFESRRMERISIMEALFSERPEKATATGSWRSNGPVQGGMPVFALDIDTSDTHEGLAAKMDEKGELPLPSMDEAKSLMSAFEGLPGSAVVWTGSGAGQILLRGSAWSTLRATQTAMLVEEALGFSIDRGPITMHGPLRVWGTERFKESARGNYVNAVVSDASLRAEDAVSEIARRVALVASETHKPVPVWSEVVPRMNARLKAQGEREKAARDSWRARADAAESGEERPGDRLNASVSVVDALEEWGCAISLSGRSFRIARSSGRWPSDSDGSILETGVAFFHSPAGAFAAGVNEGVCTPFGLLIAACDDDASLAARVVVQCEKDGSIADALSWLGSPAEDIARAFPKRGRMSPKFVAPAAGSVGSTLQRLGPLF